MLRLSAPGKILQGPLLRNFARIAGFSARKAETGLYEVCVPGTQSESFRDHHAVQGGFSAG